MTAAELIDLSIREKRTVTAYPETPEDFRSLYDALTALCDDEPAEESGEGRSGNEARGWVEFWGFVDGDEWRVDLVSPPK